MAAVIKDIYEKTKDNFYKAGIENPAFNSLCLVEKVFGITHQDMIVNPSLTADEAKIPELERLIKRRISGEPLQYIIGEWEFYGYKFKVGKGVLIPRDDTEVLLRACLDILKSKSNAKVIDLCTGSGALAVAVAKETAAEVYAVEKSAEALPYLYENIKLNKAAVKVVEGDIFECHTQFEDKSFDLILSNPPYIKSDEIAALQTEVGYEPKMALDGGSDGYDFYRFIISEWSKKLRQGGTLAFELGEDQYETVKALMTESGFTNITPHLDFGNIHRAVNGTLNAK